MALTQGFTRVLYVLTPWSRGLSDKLTVPQLLKISPNFREPEISVPHSQDAATYTYPDLDRSVLCPHLTSLRSILILSSHLHLGLPSGLLASCFSTKTINAPPLLHIPAIRSAHLSLFDLITRTIRWYLVRSTGYKVRRLQSSPFPSYLAPLRPNYTSRHPILEHFQPKVLPPLYIPVNYHCSNAAHFFINHLVILLTVLCEETQYSLTTKGKVKSKIKKIQPVTFHKSQSGNRGIARLNLNFGVRFAVRDQQYAPETN